MTKEEIIKILKSKCNDYDLPKSLNIELIASLLTKVQQPDIGGSLPFPSQKEIKEEAQKRWGDYFQMRDAFELGAEWMKKKSGNGNGVTI